MKIHDYASDGDVAGVLKELRKCHIDVLDQNNVTPLMYAAIRGENGHTHVMQELISQGADVNLRANVDGNNKGNGGCAALYMAAERNHVAAATILISNGAMLDWQYNEGWTALHMALSRRSFETARVLLERGCNPSIANDHGQLPSDFARDNGAPQDIMSKLTTSAAASNQTTSKPNSAAKAAGKAVAKDAFFSMAKKGTGLI